MSSQRCTAKFKDMTVRQVVDRGHSVDEISERLSMSAHNLYNWIKAFKSDDTKQQASELVESRIEIFKLPVQLRRTMGSATSLERPRGTLQASPSEKTSSLSST